MTPQVRRVRMATAVLSSALGIAGITTLFARAQTPAGQATFRSASDLVTIDVAVRASGTPVGGLGAGDFLLLDNGVPQKVEAVELEAVPVDITVLVETSADVAPKVSDVTEQARKIMALARPTDRVRVMSIGTYISDLIPIQPAATLPPLGDQVPAGLPSAHDGIAAALLRRVEPDRRHLIVAITNGIDSMSVIDAATLREIARRSSATLHVAQIDIAIVPMSFPPLYDSERERLDHHKCAAAGICTPPRPYWRPYDDEQFDVLAAAAEATGGEVHLPGIFRDRTAADVFNRVFADYRRSYLLRYVPQGVARVGWHDVTVTIPKQQSLTVHARRGYLVEPGGTTTGGDAGPGATLAPPARPASSGPVVPVAIEDITSAYDAGRYPVVFAALRQALAPVASIFGPPVSGPGRLPDLIRDFERGGNPWPANPHREAAFALELAEAGLVSRNRLARGAAGRLLVDYRKLVRDPLGPEIFERYWLWTELTVLEGANQPAFAQSFVDDAIARFPDEPRFHLARAFFADQRRPLDVLTGDVPAAVATYVREVSALYDVAMRFDATAPEARVRKAWLLHRAGRETEALTLLDAARDLPQDRGFTYLRHLFRGRVLDALGRFDVATEAYRAALTADPSGQSARVGLMTGLMRLGDRRAAESLAEAIQTASAESPDPWWSYWLGDYRLYAEIIGRLREQTR